MSVDYPRARGKFERWAVECRKPRYQSPCSGLQKYECVLTGGDRWRMKKCHLAVQKKWCKCKALSKYRLSKLEPEERRMQRAFLQEHTSVDWRGYKPRFLKTVAGARSRRQRHVAAASQPELEPEPEAEPEPEPELESESSVLRDVAEDELEQVELIMEDISDEISNLEVTFHFCFSVRIEFDLIHLGLI